MPTPNELRVLRMAIELGAVTKRKISSKMGINTEYTGYLLESLCKREFLSFISPGRFELAPKGKDALVYHLHHVRGILEAKAHGTVQQIDKINEKMRDYEVHVESKMPGKMRNRQEA